MRRLLATLVLAAALTAVPAAGAAVTVKLKRDGKVLHYSVRFTKPIWKLAVTLATADPTSQAISSYHVKSYTSPKVKGMQCLNGSQSVTCYAPGASPFGLKPKRGKPIPAGTLLKGTITFNKAIGTKKVVAVSGDTPTGGSGSAGFKKQKLA
jgi:hypothetical protein